MAQLEPDISGCEHTHILCAVSGGADSVALLHLLAGKRDTGLISLSAAHFEHGIRGADSVGDLEFTRELCRRLNVPLYVGRADVPAEAERAHLGLEKCARELRHAFLRKTRMEAGADYIALAHHRRDRAETVLMHLLRGGGVTGAGALPRKDGALLRPLIAYPPEALREYLVSIGETWREDATNFVADNPRNALRLNVFPLLDRIYPGFEAALDRFADISADEDAYMEAAAAEFIRTRVQTSAGIVMLPRDADTPVLRRALRRFLPRESSFEDTERARTCSGFCDIGEGTRCYGAEELIYILTPLTDPGSAPVSPDGLTRLPGVCTLRAEKCPPVPIRDNGPAQVLDASALAGAVLRLRRDGDFIRPLGMRGQRRLLSDVLTDKKISLPLRERLPVLARGGEIIWARGVCISETARVTPASEAVKLEIDMEEYPK